VHNAFAKSVFPHPGTPCRRTAKTKKWKNNEECENAFSINCKTLRRKIKNL
jgi:hypothetical protein